MGSAVTPSDIVVAAVGADIGIAATVPDVGIGDHLPIPGISMSLLAARFAAFIAANAFERREMI
jgi:hypothetical protein